MIDLKMPVAALLERSFTANDIKTSTPNNVNVRTAALQHLYSVEGSKKDENRSTPWDNTHTDEVNFGCINSTSLSGEEPTCSLPEKNSLTENRLHKDTNMEQSSFPFLDPGGNIKFLGSTLEFDALDLSQLSSMLQQHVESKYRRPKLLHLWRFLDFYLVYIITACLDAMYIISFGASFFLIHSKYHILRLLLLTSSSLVRLSLKMQRRFPRYLASVLLQL